MKWTHSSTVRPPLKIVILQYSQKGVAKIRLWHKTTCWPVLLSFVSLYSIIFPFVCLCWFFCLSSWIRNHFQLCTTTYSNPWELGPATEILQFLSQFLTLFWFNFSEPCVIKDTSKLNNLINSFEKSSDLQVLKHRKTGLEDWLN